MLLPHLGFGGHGDRLKKLFGGQTLLRQTVKNLLGEQTLLRQSMDVNRPLF